MRCFKVKKIFLSLILISVLAVLCSAFVSAAECTGTEIDMCFMVQEGDPCGDFYQPGPPCYQCTSGGSGCTTGAECDCPSSNPCGDTITSNTTLTQDYTGCTDVGFTIGANNIILDCAGYDINGTDTADSIGIDLGSYDGVTIKNCLVRDFTTGAKGNDADNLNIIGNQLVFNDASSGGGGTTGIHLENSDNNNISHNNLSFNTGSGLYLEGDNNFVWNNTANNNTDYGIFIDYRDFNDYTTNNVLLENTANYNSESEDISGAGIYVRSNNTNITRNTADNNILSGLQLQYAYNAVVDDCEFSYNGKNGIYINGGTGHTLQNMVGSIDYNGEYGAKFINLNSPSIDVGNVLLCENPTDIYCDAGSGTYITDTGEQTADTDTCGLDIENECPTGNGGDPIPEFSTKGLIIAIIVIAGSLLIVFRKKKS